MGVRLDISDNAACLYLKIILRKFKDLKRFMRVKYVCVSFHNSFKIEFKQQFFGSLPFHGGMKKRDCGESATVKLWRGVCEIILMITVCH
jgi:hypothetical protein